MSTTYACNAGVPFTPYTLAQYKEEDQKQVLGEAIYPIAETVINQIHKERNYPGKITGMLLEIDNTHLLFLMANRKMLVQKVIL